MGRESVTNRVFPASPGEGSDGSGCTGRGRVKKEEVERRQEEKTEVARQESHTPEPPVTFVRPYTYTGPLAGETSSTTNFDCVERVLSRPDTQSPFLRVH